MLMIHLGSLPSVERKPTMASLRNIVINGQAIAFDLRLSRKY